MGIGGARRPRFLLLLMAMALSACSGDGEKSAAGGGGRSLKTRKTFRVALLTSGPVDDAGWNADAREGLMRIRNELGAEVSHKASANAGERLADPRDYARSGYDLVFGHGAEYSGPMSEAAPEFPKTVFISTGGDKVGPNYSYMDFRLEEATYLLGIVAGATTKSGKIGVVAGRDVPPVRRSNASLIQGVRLANPQAEVRVSFLDEGSDAGKARNAARALIRDGVDLLYQNADSAGAGVFEAAKEHPGVYAFGSNRDQNDVAPDVVLASAVIDIPAAFLRVARMVRDGGFRAQPILLGVKDGVVSLEINERLRDGIPARAFPLVESEKGRIASGELDVDALK